MLKKIILLSSFLCTAVSPTTPEITLTDSMRVEIPKAVTYFAAVCALDPLMTFCHEMSHLAAHKLCYGNPAHIHIGPPATELNDDKKPIWYQNERLTVYTWPFFKGGFCERLGD